MYSCSSTTEITSIRAQILGNRYQSVVAKTIVQAHLKMRRKINIPLDRR